MTILQFPTRLQYDDRVYAPRDDAFDLHAILTEEGIAISAHENNRSEFLGKYALDESFITIHRE
jgi:hypothetical protein